MKLFKVLVFVGALGLLAFTSGCRGCGCSCSRPDTNGGDEVVVPDPDKGTTTPADNPDNGKGGTNAGKF
ncbi:MAG: hypothetical protein WC712_06710 [Candidatus Brocadiia bacterium]